VWQRDNGITKEALLRVEVHKKERNNLKKLHNFI
jgi:hypothetical protein